MKKRVAKKMFEEALAAVGDEADWADIDQAKTWRDLNEKTFLGEYCWVVFAAGFNVSILSGKFGELQRAFKEFEPAAVARMRPIRREKLPIRHQVKADGFLRGAKLVHKVGWSDFKTRVEEEGVDALKVLPWIKDVTKYHLAKNIGLADVPYCCTLRTPEDQQIPAFLELRASSTCNNRVDESQRLWLDEFRKAVVRCVTLARADGQDSEAPLLEVTAFASIAPVRSEGVSTAKLNCEIANRRADAVGAYLAHGGVDAPNDEHKRKWECPSVKWDFKKAQKHCAPSVENDDYSYVQAGSQEPIFKVRVHQWQDPSTMQGGKPADDGTVPDRRRYDVELFNRSVHISAPRGFCRPRKSEQSEGSSMADPTTNVEPVEPQEEDTNALDE